MNIRKGVKVNRHPPEQSPDNLNPVGNPERYGQQTVAIQGRDWKQIKNTNRKAD